MVRESFFLSNSKVRKHLLFRPGKWTADEISVDSGVYELANKTVSDELYLHASQLMKADVALYKEKIENQKKQGWLKTVLSKGTSKDKVAAWVVLIQDSHLHNFCYLDSLISLLVKERRKALETLDTVKDLFLQELLVPNRKLKTFIQHPLVELEKLTNGNRELMDQKLLVWYYEDQLKKKYKSFIDALQILCKDSVEKIRKKVTNVILELLNQNPEQEKLLLSILVNKLGDPSTKVASNVVHLLNKLIVQHPKMKLVTAVEVERLLYRTNISSKAQFYAICFLSNMKLNRDENDLASRLIGIYFNFFKLYIGKGEVDTKILSAVLTGVNKTYLCARVKTDAIIEQMEALYAIIHLTKFNISLQALMLLHQVMDVSDKESDRFYVALYKKMLDHELPTSNKLPLFLNILYKSMKKDHIEIRVMAFVKRLLQVCQFMSPSMICSSLYLLSQLASEKSSVFKFCKENEETDDDESCDNNESKETMVQHMDAGYKKVETNVLNKRSPTSFKSSWMHKTNSNLLSNVYDPLHRNPAFCRADMDCLWELNIFLYHYHPTVVIFARAIVNGEKIDYSGDPLENYAFKKFLDRFICKNPKKVHEGPNENQPLKESIKLESENCDIAESEDCLVADQEEDCVDDDEDIDDDGKFDEEEVDFGKDFKDEFKDLIASDIDNETLMDEDESNDKVQAAGEYLREIESSDEESSNNEDNEDIDDQTLGRYTDKVLKQMKWEEGNEKVWSKKHRIHRKRSNNTNYLRKNIQKEFCKNKRFKR